MAGKKTAAPAAATGKAAATGDRLTGADKKNRDQKRHGAVRGGGKTDSTKKHGGFDRKNASGRTGGQSKDGRGKYGFGSAEQDAEEATKNPNAALGGADDEAEEADEAADAEPEVPSISMEEFLAQRAAEKKALSSIAGVKKERVVKAEGTVLGKSQQEILLEATVAAKEQGPKGLSKRLQAKQEVTGIKFGFRTENASEDRPPRREFTERKPREDRPRRDNDGKGRDFKGKGGNDRSKGNDKPQRKNNGPNLADANAFPSL